MNDIEEGKCLDLCVHIARLETELVVVKKVKSKLAEQVNFWGCACLHRGVEIKRLEAELVDSKNDGELMLHDYNDKVIELAKWKAIHEDNIHEYQCLASKLHDVTRARDSFFTELTKAKETIRMKSLIIQKYQKADEEGQF